MLYGFYGVYTFFRYDILDKIVIEEIGIKKIIEEFTEEVAAWRRKARRTA